MLNEDNKIETKQERKNLRGLLRDAETEQNSEKLAELIDQILSAFDRGERP